MKIIILDKAAPEKLKTEAERTAWLIMKSENEYLSFDLPSCNIKMTQALTDLFVDLKQGDLKKYGIYSRYNPAAAGQAKKKRRAPQLTKLGLQQQTDDDQKRSLYLGKKEKLNKESDDYETLLFIKSYLDQWKLFYDVYDVKLFYDVYDVKLFYDVLSVDRDLKYINASGKELSDQDWSLIVNEYRSMIENELQGICDNVSNLTYGEAYARHLKDFRTGFKLSAQVPQDHHSHLQNEDGKIMSSKPSMFSKLRLRGEGRSGSCKTPSPIDIYLHMNDYLDDHSECCVKKNHLETSYLDLMNSLPKEEEYPEQEYVVADNFDDDF